MPRTVYFAIPLISYRERQAYVSHTPVYPSHTCAAFSVIPPPPQPLSYSPYSPPLLPFVGAASAILVPPTPHAQVFHPSGGSHVCACAHVHKHTRAVARKGAPSHGRERRDDKGGEEEVAEETVWGRGGRAYSGILRAARGRRWKKRCRFEERWGWGSDLISIALSPLSTRHVSLYSRPIVPRRVHSLQASSHGVTFLVGTPVPIFRRLHSAFFARYNLYRESLQREALQLFRRDAILREDNVRFPLTKSFINIRPYSRHIVGGPYLVSIYIYEILIEVIKV